MTRFSKLRFLVAGAVLALGASAAYAGPFQVTPSGDGLAPGITQPFTADSLGGSSSTLISATGAGPGFVNYSASGYIDFQGFSYQGNGVGAGVSGLTLDYGMYAVFTQTFTCPGALTPGSADNCIANTISLNLYGNPGDSDAGHFNQATLSGGGSVTNTKLNAGDILLGTANLITSGTAGINLLGGAFENVNTNFALTSQGSAFFTEPVPFYNLAFSEYNNTSTGLACNSTQCAVTFETGSTNFNYAPEPASLAIFGLGMAGLAALRRKKSA